MLQCCALFLQPCSPYFTPVNVITEHGPSHRGHRLNFLFFTTISTVDVIYTPFYWSIKQNLMFKPVCTPTCWRSLVWSTCVLTNTASASSIWWLKACRLRRAVHFTSTMSWLIGTWLSAAICVLPYVLDIDTGGGRWWVLVDDQELFSWSKAHGCMTMRLLCFCGCLKYCSIFLSLLKVSEWRTSRGEPSSGYSLCPEQGTPCSSQTGPASPGLQQAGIDWHCK